jgi:hypothetical protein
MFGFQTIIEGQHVALWDEKSGKREIVHGPARIGTWGKRVEALKTFMAGPTQYLLVQHRDGRVMHQRGPAVLWMDPVQHAAVSIADAITLDANEALVVYTQGDDGKVKRRIVRGPEMFVPQAQEWLHEFRWHGADPRDPRKKIPRGWSSRSCASFRIRCISMLNPCERPTTRCSPSSS